VVCSIHQPRSNIYDMFDYLLLLDGGRTVYFGPQPGVVPYFSNELERPCGHFHNPADVFLDLLEEDKDAVREGWQQGP
jgi:ABC-type multidrug transport system ATPase subunit